MYDEFMIDPRYDYKLVQARPTPEPWNTSGNVAPGAVIPVVEAIMQREVARGWEFHQVKSVGMDPQTGAVVYLLSFRKAKRLLKAGKKPKDL